MAELMPALARDGVSTLSEQRHLADCERCQAELERYRSLLAALGALASHTAEAPPELVASLRAIPAEARPMRVLQVHLARNRQVYLGGTAAMAVAGTAGAILWLTTHARRAEPPRPWWRDLGRRLVPA